MVIMNIDMPKMCAECPCCYETEGVYFGCCQLRLFCDDNITHENRLECDIEEYLQNDTKPEWCPLVKVEEEQPEQITAPFYYIFECNDKTEHVMFDNIVLSGNQPDDKDRVKLNCDMEVSKDVFNGLIELQREKTKNDV